MSCPAQLRLGLEGHHIRFGKRRNANISLRPLVTRVRVAHP